jgi:hypothetical protein
MKEFAIFYYNYFSLFRGSGFLRLFTKKFLFFFFCSAAPRVTLVAQQKNLLRLFQLLF